MALLSKGVALCRSICILTRENFPEEAFGLSRTLIDIAFTLRFIANKDIEERASRYMNYFAKDRVHWAQTVIPSVITPKAANGYHFKTGHSTSVRDKSFYSFEGSRGKAVLIPPFHFHSRRALWKEWKAFCAFQAAVGIIK